MKLHGSSKYFLQACGTFLFLKVDNFWKDWMEITQHLSWLVLYLDNSCCLDLNVKAYHQ